MKCHVTAHDQWHARERARVDATRMIFTRLVG